MEHQGLQYGMFWGGMLLMAVPVLFGLGVGAFLLYRYRSGRGVDTPDVTGRDR